MSFNEPNPVQTVPHPSSPPPPYDQNDFVPLPKLPFPGSFIPPSVIPIIPRGLECLSHTDRLIVHQKDANPMGLLESDAKNKFIIKNGTGQMIYFTSSDFDDTPCCQPASIFELKVTDNHDQEVLRFSRLDDCATICLPWGLQRLEVATPEKRCGHLEQVWSPFKPKFKVFNTVGETVLRIEGSPRHCLTGGKEFKILSGDRGLIIGRIVHRWSGPIREMFAEGDHFDVTFPIDLDVYVKTILLGSCFLFDRMYFQKSEPHPFIHSSSD